MLAGIINNHWAVVRTRTEPKLYADWHNGSLRIYGAFVNRYKVCFNIYLNITPKIRDGELKIKVNECSLGRINIPVDLAEKMLQKLIETQMQNDDFKSRMKMFKNVHAEGENDLVIILDPIPVAEILQQMY